MVLKREGGRMVAKLELEDPNVRAWETEPPRKGGGVVCGRRYELRMDGWNKGFGGVGGDSLVGWEGGWLLVVMNL